MPAPEDGTNLAAHRNHIIGKVPEGDIQEDACHSRLIDLKGVTLTDGDVGWSVTVPRTTLGGTQKCLDVPRVVFVDGAPRLYEGDVRERLHSFS